MRRAIILSALFTFALPVISQAQGNLEIPQNGSVQSGVGIVSGWYCEADRIEIAFDGGDPIEASYGTTRQDTVEQCGDDDNGFALLWAFQLLGPGKHEVVAYADGVEFRRRTFSVTDISDGGFLRGAAAEARVQGFPTLDFDVVLKWQEANQNFVISDYLLSMDSFDVTGLWEATDTDGNASLISWFTRPDFEDPSFGQVWAVVTDVQVVNDVIQFGQGVYLYGQMQKDFAVLIADPIIRSGYEGQYHVTFEEQLDGPPIGFMELVSCSPMASCPDPVGTTWLLESALPEDESDLYPGEVSASEADAGEETVVGSIQQAMEANRPRLMEILREKLAERELESLPDAP
ncbi:MAG: hypothetical protein P8Y92_16600 [Halioglobus sp.]|jgi:hypothetical protein